MPPERDAEPVRVGETVTPERHALVDGLVTCHRDTVVLASTGVSWGPLFERLEQRGLTPSLVNARPVTTVPGRQTAWHAAQGLQKLHPLGLVHASCRPDAERYVLRTRRRHRAMVIEHRAPHLLHRQTTLQLMNLPVREGLTAITGVTGPAS